MNLSEKRFSLKRASSRNQVSAGLSGRSAVFGVAIMGWCVAIQGAEIHDAAELGDLARVKAYLSQDPKQIDLVDAKGRTVLARATRSGKKELVEFLAQQLVNNPEAVDVKETQGDTASVLELRVAKEDLGRVIGKQGRTAKSIRTILNAVASRTSRKVVLEIVEDR